MPEEPPRITDLFPCRLADRYLSALPQGAGTRSEAWTRRYHVLTIGGTGLMASGTVTLSRQPSEPGSFLLFFTYDKRLAGRTSSRTQARIICTEDALATPLEWTMDVGSHDSANRAVPIVSYGQTGYLSGGILAIKAFGKTRRSRIQGAATINWALFEALGRLPQESPARLPFTLLDDFDQAKPGVVLTLAGVETVILGGTEEIIEHETQLEQGRVFRPNKQWVGGSPGDLARYHLTGPGIVPWVFRVDSAGRMLLAAAGTEAYCLAHDGPFDMTSHEGVVP